MRIESIEWKSMVPTSGIAARDAYEAVEKVRKANGGDLTDDAVVDAARPKDHVLHAWFEWDDSKAAAQHRRAQARELIRSFRVVYAEAPETPVRAYEVHARKSPNSEERTAYRTTDEIMADPEARDRLIAAAIRSAMDFRRRFRGLHELQKVWEALDAAVEELVASK